MLVLLKEQTHLYTVQKSEYTTFKELGMLTGLYLHTGLWQLLGNRAYWENDTRCPMVADNMSQNHFQNLLAPLPFSDNTGLSDRQAENKCCKSRKWLDMLQTMLGYRLRRAQLWANDVSERDRLPNRGACEGQTPPLGIKSLGLLFFLRDPLWFYSLKGSTRKENLTQHGRGSSARAL